MKLRLNDKVIIIAGKDKGKTGDIIKVLPKKGTVVVKGINTYKRHVKGRDGLEGGIISIERPMNVSKVSMIDPKTAKPTRVGYQVVAKGDKVRMAKKSQTPLDTKPKSVKKK